MIPYHIYILLKDKSVHDLGNILTTTLKKHENVMFPVFPSGIVFDLIEIVLGMLTLSIFEKGTFSKLFFIQIFITCDRSIMMEYINTNVNCKRRTKSRRIVAVNTNVLRRAQVYDIHLL